MEAELFERFGLALVKGMYGLGADAMLVLGPSRRVWQAFLHEPAVMRCLGRFADVKLGMLARSSTLLEVLEEAAEELRTAVKAVGGAGQEMARALEAIDVDLRTVGRAVGAEPLPAMTRNRGWERLLAKGRADPGLGRALNAFEEALRYGNAADLQAARKRLLMHGGLNGDDRRRLVRLVDRLLNIPPPVDTGALLDTVVSRLGQLAKNSPLLAERVAFLEACRATTGRWAQALTEINRLATGATKTEWGELAHNVKGILAEVLAQATPGFLKMRGIALDEAESLALRLNVISRLAGEKVTWIVKESHTLRAPGVKGAGNGLFVDHGVFVVSVGKGAGAEVAIPLMFTQIKGGDRASAEGAVQMLTDLLRGEAGRINIDSIEHHLVFRSEALPGQLFVGTILPHSPPSGPIPSEAVVDLLPLASKAMDELTSLVMDVVWKTLHPSKP
ncbi:hypothetical protein ACIPX0_50095 [Streptomyces sp. NPDC090075]|uniref:hypothetical protein n=1 Tax=unclassified Streptomyces TaxID=2593676 RepID=UPI00380830E8